MEPFDVEIACLRGVTELIFVDLGSLQVLKTDLVKSHII